MSPSDMITSIGMEMDGRITPIYIGGGCFHQDGKVTCGKNYSIELTGEDRTKAWAVFSRWFHSRPMGASVMYA